MWTHTTLGPYAGRWRKHQQETDADVAITLPRTTDAAGTLSFGMEAEQPTGFKRRVSAELTLEDLVALRDELDALIEATRPNTAVAGSR